MRKITFLLFSIFAWLHTKATLSSVAHWRIFSFVAAYNHSSYIYIGEYSPLYRLGIFSFDLVIFRHCIVRQRASDIRNIIGSNDANSYINIGEYSPLYRLRIFSSIDYDDGGNDANNCFNSPTTSTTFDVF